MRGASLAYVSINELTFIVQRHRQPGLPCAQPAETGIQEAKAMQCPFALAGDDLDELGRRSLGNLEPTSLTAFGFQQQVVLGAGERRDSSEANGTLLGVLVRCVPFNVETA